MTDWALQLVTLLAQGAGLRAQPSVTRVLGVSDVHNANGTSSPPTAIEGNGVSESIPSSAMTTLIEEQPPRGPPRSMSRERTWSWLVIG
jgi:hypothetical protein